MLVSRFQHSLFQGKIFSILMKLATVWYIFQLKHFKELGNFKSHCGFLLKLKQAKPVNKHYLI